MPGYKVVYDVGTVTLHLHEVELGVLSESIQLGHIYWNSSNTTILKLGRVHKIVIIIYYYYNNYHYYYRNNYHYHHHSELIDPFLHDLSVLCNLLNILEDHQRIFFIQEIQGPQNLI